MSEIRPFASSDAKQVANLWLRTWRRSESDPPSALIEYFKQIFLNHPWMNLKVPSLVYENAFGLIDGFVGLIPRPMDCNGRRVIVAVSAGIMVAPEAQGQGIGLELRRKSFEGPQVLTFTDGGTDSAIRIWSKAGGEQCQLYSCTWTRLLRPAKFFVRKLRHRIGNIALLLHPFAAIADILLVRSPVNAWRVDDNDGATGYPCSPKEILQLAKNSYIESGLQPVYDEDSLQWLLDQAASGSNRGELEKIIVSTASGDPVGWYIYFAKPGGLADVLQIGGQPDRIDTVIEHMMLRARKAGCTIISGQFDKRYTSAFVNLGCSFSFRKNFIVYSVDRDMLRIVHSGNTALTRLDGEWWLNFSDGPW